MHTLILNSISKTHYDGHHLFEIEVKHIYNIEKPSETLRFQQYDMNLHNKFMLWHGVKATSLPNVLMNGLQAPPREAPATIY